MTILINIGNRKEGDSFAGISMCSNGLVTLGIAIFIFIIGSLLVPLLVTYKESW